MGFVLVLSGLLFGGIPIVEAGWGVGASLGYELVVCLVWLAAAGYCLTKPRKG